MFTTSKNLSMEIYSDVKTYFMHDVYAQSVTSNAWISYECSANLYHIDYSSMMLSRRMGVALLASSLREGSLSKFE